MNKWLSASVSQFQTFFIVPNFGGRENHVLEHIYLCAFWKATLRKELLSERDGNSNIIFIGWGVRLTNFLRKELLSERDGNV